MAATLTDAKGRTLVLECECSAHDDHPWRWRAISAHAVRYGAARTLPQAIAMAETAAGLR